ncbi:uncharacterized protein A1O9_06736 [Exophiala aquamarina CBS 119918]|uniref:BZIP domain-containing protein n=1 Tax=Exophiala aquamarina CBS 119918 TaxID=1182545 RepID=A0A072PB92_9EURO|nr:uncharacterized protein A1O9_06736 [Exophiala aquamarina CBS 119918]KEF56548.1 hypothetical protein A1O9_06736 [Exophiala aquamarina CBS 119918]
MTSHMANVNTNFDPDYDSFLNLENDFTPSSTSPAIKSIPMLTPQSSIPGSATTYASSSAPQTFPGPSFQYDAYHQQTGIPIGALANTFAVNRASGLQYHEGNGGFIMPTETLNMPLSTLDEYDFSQGTDMDFDTDSPNDLPSMFYSEQASRPAQFVSPNTLVAHNNMSSTPIQRIYPGMHSQQAAQAKAQQAQKQQMARQQQQARPDGQKPLPSPTKSQASKDPLVEESISKVLNRMRQESVTSTATDGDGANVGMSNMPRIKKDEDDMDEDERLLASEEGKKLSSKERRQLRNKVSARAFRSRRKEYIGQLEGEIAAKTQEANDMRAQNEQLREENNRLTDLTRMLLSSQAFAGFLQELSQSGLPAPNTHVNTQQQKQARSQPQPQSQSNPRLKDVSTNEVSRQMRGQQPQIGMALIPETPIDLSAFQSSNAWMTALPTSDFQVYAVTEIPEAPALDLEAISGKPDSIFSRPKPTKDVPMLQDSVESWTKPAEHKASVVDETVPLDQGAFALYFETPSIPTIQDKSADALGIEISEEQRSAELKNMCDDLDEACARISRYTVHMN